MYQCGVHGALSLEEVMKSGKHASGNVRYKCRVCQHRLQKNHYEKNKAKVLAKNSQYRKDNHEKVSKSKISTLAYARLQLQKAGWAKSDILPVVIELKLAQLKLLQLAKRKRKRNE